VTRAIVGGIRSLSLTIRQIWITYVLEMTVGVRA
jgi:hypothetical protein